MLNHRYDWQRDRRAERASSSSAAGHPLSLAGKLQLAEHAKAQWRARSHRGEHSPTGQRHGFGPSSRFKTSDRGLVY